MRSRSLRRSTSDGTTPMSRPGRRVHGGADYGRVEVGYWDLSSNGARAPLATTAICVATCELKRVRNESISRAGSEA